MKPFKGTAGGGGGVATVALSLPNDTIDGVSSLLVSSITLSSGCSSNVGVTGGESGVELSKATNPVSTFFGS